MQKFCLNPSRRRRALAGIAALGLIGSLAGGLLPGSPVNVANASPYGVTASNDPRNPDNCPGGHNGTPGVYGSNTWCRVNGQFISTASNGNFAPPRWAGQYAVVYDDGTGESVYYVWCLEDSAARHPRVQYPAGSALPGSTVGGTTSYYGASLQHPEAVNGLLALMNMSADASSPFGGFTNPFGGTVSNADAAAAIWLLQHWIVGDTRTSSGQPVVSDLSIYGGTPAGDVAIQFATNFNYFVNPVLTVAFDVPEVPATTFHANLTVVTSGMWNTTELNSPLQNTTVDAVSNLQMSDGTPITPGMSINVLAHPSQYTVDAGGGHLSLQAIDPTQPVSLSMSFKHFGPNSWNAFPVEGGQQATGFYNRPGDVSISDNATLNPPAIAASPVIGTTATDTVDGDHIIGVGGSIIDAVAYSGLTPGQQYTLVAKIMTQAGVDTGATASTTFTPTAADGTVNVGPIVVPANLNGTFVVFEELFLGTDTTAVPVAVHQDLTDTNQTFTTQAPTVGTTATDTADGDHIIGVGGSITDTVAYTGLIPGQQYTLVAKLMTQAGVDTGITASAAFTPTAAAGTVDVGPIVVPANLAGTFVVFEDLYFGTDTTVTPIGSHHDLTDTNQTVRTGILIGTVATDNLDGDHVVGTSGSVIDTVAYSGLTPGQQYTLVAKIMTQAGVDTGITANAKFTPSNPVGSVAVGPISIPANLAGTFVVFEDLYLGTDTTVPATAVHHDLTDTNQTFTTGVPTITTKVDQVDRKPGETNFDVGTVTGVDPAFVGRIVLNVYRDLPGDAITGAAVCASAPAHTITYDIAGNGDHASPVYTVAADEVPGVVYVHQESLVAPDGTVLATDMCGAPTELTTITKKSSGGDFGGTF